MTYAREKKQMLAWMALLAPLPLPFSQTLEWPALFMYAIVLIYFLQRVEKQQPTLVPNWVLNLLGLVYLPILFIDLRVSLARSRPVAALLHLIMFLILVKLFSMRREKEKWHLVMASFFLFLGAMATSTHLTVGIYLFVFMVLTLLILARFAFLHMLATQKRPAGETGDAGGPKGARLGSKTVPYRMPLAVGTLLVTLIGIPTFATMPRFREPFFLGPGGNPGSLIRTTGFSDSVDLSLTSSIRGNRDVVMRVQYEGGEQDSAFDMRFKGATYDRYEDRRWHRQLQYSHSLKPELDETHGRVFRMGEEQVTGKVEVFRERMNSRGLILPMEAVGVAIGQPMVLTDLGGAAYLPSFPTTTIRYQVLLADQPMIQAQLTSIDAEKVDALTGLDQSGITDRMRQMAREVMGEGTANEQIDRLERHLLSEYSYTLDFLGRDGLNPLEDFLFTYKSGHCEYFASSMVLLLRAENIPARLATGFLGAEYNPLEGYYMVRQDNAHAWVEAFTPERGWRVYDPTPPEGRPALAQRSLLQLINQIYDYMTFRWDRYILTYGAEDQRSFFQQIRQRLSELWFSLTGGGAVDEDLNATETGVNMGGDDEVRKDDLWLSRLPVSIAATLFAVACLGLILWRRSRVLTGEAAYRRLRRLLQGAGLKVTEAIAPLELRDLAIAHYPSGADPTRRLVAHYIRESFAEEPLGQRERADLKEDLRAVREAMKREDRQRKKTRRATR